MTRQLPVYIGWDVRQPISYNVAQHSVTTTAKSPVSITPLCLDALPIERQGLTQFTYSRYLVPWLQEYQGWAVFMDADVIVLADIAELFAEADPAYAVMVSKNVKKFEWGSVILWNCGHEANRLLTPEYVDDSNSKLFRFEWLTPDQIGPLPAEWNHLVGYDAERTDAKLVHFTMGIPPFPETNMCEYAGVWADAHQHMNGAAPWAQLMGQSVHAAHLPDGRVLPWLHPEVRATQEERRPTQHPVTNEQAIEKAAE